MKSVHVSLYPPRRRAYGAAALLLLYAGIAGNRTAHAATPQPLSAMARAVSAARGYRATITISIGANSPQSTSNRIDATVVRQGHLTRLYMLISTTSGGLASLTEFVSTGKHACLRQGSQGQWLCESLSGSAAALLDLSPQQALNRFAQGARFASTGSRVVRGQRCDGYLLTTAAPKLHTRSTLYIAIGTHRPVQESSTMVSTGFASTTSQTTITWSNWNDPHLRIPPVPAS